MQAHTDKSSGDHDWLDDQISIHIGASTPTPSPQTKQRVRSRLLERARDQEQLPAIAHSRLNAHRMRTHMIAFTRACAHAAHEWVISLLIDEHAYRRAHGFDHRGICTVNRYPGGLWRVRTEWAVLA
jgi:hypothetical protein